MTAAARCVPATGAAGDGPGRPGAAAAAQRPGQRQAAVYASVLRKYLTGGDHSFGQGHRFPAVFVLDRSVPGAGDPMREPAPVRGDLIPRDARDAIVAALADVGPLRFVASRDAVVEDAGGGDAAGCPTVRDGGILVTLGPVAGDGDRVEVGVHGYVACQAATWLTYVVERAGGGWAVRGTTGPMAVS